MKLLQINSVLSNFGSTGKIVNQIGDVAIRNGWESHIAYGRWGCRSQSSLLKLENTRDVYLHVAYTRLTDRHGLCSNKATRRLIRYIQDLKPDIIHLHVLHGYYLNYKMLFEYLNTLDTPIVWTQHDCWAFTGHCAHFTEAGCYKWREQCHHCPISHDYPCAYRDNSAENFRLKKQYFTGCKNLTIVTVSEWLRRMVSQSFLGKYNIRTIYNGTDLTAFRPRPTHTPGKRFTIVSTAVKWTRQKGLYDFYELRKQLPDDIDIKLIGLSQKQIDNLPAGITGLEKTSSIDELATAYSEADIVVNLSYQETFGMTTAEGMACGTPCIVYNATACPELVTPDTGIIVEPGNIQQTAQAIQQIKNNGKAAYTQNCRKRAESLFDKNRQFEKYIALYNQLTGNTDA